MGSRIVKASTGAHIECRLCRQGLHVLCYSHGPRTLVLSMQEILALSLVLSLAFFCDTVMVTRFLLWKT